jgi:hypothetical protein
MSFSKKPSRESQTTPTPLSSPLFTSANWWQKNNPPRANNAHRKQSVATLTELFNKIFKELNDI